VGDQTYIEPKGRIRGEKRAGRGDGLWGGGVVGVWGRRGVGGVRGGTKRLVLVSIEMPKSDFKFCQIFVSYLYLKY
jgi:hypothetical protein